MASIKLNEVLFIDLFSPKKIEEFILVDRIKKQLAKGIYTHLMFYGNHGIGKSSLAKHLAKKHPTLYINVANDGKIETLREKIIKFCNEIPINFGDFDSDIKIVILDEVGRKASEAFYEGLKGVMDEYNDNVRFIATTNYIQNLPASLKSRFTLVNFGFTSSEERNFVYDGYTNRMKNIIKGIGMKATDDVLKNMVDMNFPDFRDSLQVLQTMKISGISDITKNDILTATFDMIDLYNLILTGGIKNPELIHAELMGKYANAALDVLTSLNDGFIKYITKKELKYASIIPDTLIDVAKYSDMAGRIDPALAMKACVFSIMQTVNRKFPTNDKA